MQRKPNAHVHGTSRTEACVVKSAPDDADVNVGKGEKFTSLHEEAFGIVMDMILSQPLVVRDEELPGLIASSYERKYAAIDEWLSRRLSEIKKHWKRILEVPHHRVMGISRLRLYATAAELREKNKLSWAQLARQVDPIGFRNDPRAAIERLRKGVDSVRKKRGKDFNPMHYIPLVFTPRKLRSTALEGFVAPSPKWARKKLQELRGRNMHLVQRANLKPQAILNNARTEYLYWADYVAALRTPRKRKLKELIRDERLMVYHCLFSLTEDAPKTDAEKLRMFTEEIRRLCYALLSITGDLKKAHRTPLN